MTTPLDFVSRHWWLLLLRGILAIAFGIVAFAWPGLTAIALVLLLGAYLLVDGVVGIVDCLRHWNALRDRWLWLLDAVLSVLAGLAALLLPGATAVALLVLVAAWAIVAGMLRIALAVRLRRVMDGEWLMALGGVLSIAFGALLLTIPGPGIVSLVWLIGAWALLFGVILVALSLRLCRFGQRWRTAWQGQG